MPKCCWPRRPAGTGRACAADPRRRIRRAGRRGGSGRWCGGGCGASRSPTSSAARVPRDRAGGRPAGADPAPGDRAAGRAGARAGPRRGARRRHRLGRDRAGDRRRAARVRGDRHRHLGRRAGGGARQRRAARARETGSSFVEAGRVPGSGASFDLLVANLPYVAEADWASLAPEVTAWEPREALLGRPRRSRRDPRARESLAVRAGAALPWWRWRSGTGRPRRSPAAPRRRLRRVETRAATSPGSSASSGRCEGDDLVLVQRACDSGPRSSRSSATAPRRRARAGALHRRRRGRRLPRRRPLRARLRPARRGGDRADPPAQGPRRRQALGGHVLLAAGDAGAGRRTRPAHPRGGRRRCCRAR